MWQKAQASLRFTESCLSYSISFPSSSTCWTRFSGDAGQPLDRLRLEAVNLGLDLRVFLQRLRREHCAGLLRAPRIFARCGGDHGRRNRQKRVLCLHFLSSENRR
jgi:hypothetical protein